MACCQMCTLEQHVYSYTDTTLKFQDMILFQYCQGTLKLFYNNFCSIWLTGGDGASFRNHYGECITCTFGWHTYIQYGPKSKQARLS